MILPKGQTVYVSGKKFVGEIEIPDKLASLAGLDVKSKAPVGNPPKKKDTDK